jgi:hypothetical protein
MRLILSLLLGIASAQAPVPQADNDIQWHTGTLTIGGLGTDTASKLEITGGSSPYDTSIKIQADGKVILPPGMSAEEAIRFIVWQMQREIDCLHQNYQEQIRKLTPPEMILTPNRGPQLI